MSKCGCQASSKPKVDYRTCGLRDTLKNPTASGIAMKKGVFEATRPQAESRVKEGGLRRALKLEKNEKLTLPILNGLLKHKDGTKFKLWGHETTMTSKLRKQIQLAVNYMK